MGLLAIVLLYDPYTVYLQLQIHRMRRRLFEREELFRLISESANVVLRKKSCDKFKMLLVVVNHHYPKRRKGFMGVVTRN